MTRKPNALLTAAVLAGGLAVSFTTFAQGNSPSAPAPQEHHEMMGGQGTMGGGDTQQPMGNMMPMMNEMNKMAENCNRMMESASRAAPPATPGQAPGQKSPG
jgi:hypothetical protein